MTITIKEARQEEDKRFFRMIAGVEEETEQEDEDRISLEQEEDREENSEPEDKE